MAKVTSINQIRIGVIDELGELQAEVVAFKPKLERIKELKAQVQQWAEEHSAAEAVSFEGRSYTAIAAAKEDRRRITDMVKLYALLGKKRFLALCGFTLKNARASLSPVEQTEVIALDKNVADREISTVARPKAA